MHRRSQIPTNIKDEARNVTRSTCLVNCLEVQVVSYITVGPTTYTIFFRCVTSTYVRCNMFPAFNVHSYSKIRKRIEVVHNQEGHVVLTEKTTWFKAWLVSEAKDIPYRSSILGFICLDFRSLSKCCMIPLDAFVGPSHCNITSKTSLTIWCSF